MPAVSYLAWLLIVAVSAGGVVATAQTLPDPSYPIVRPDPVTLVCETGAPPVARADAERAFYTHFDAVPDDLREGQRVDVETVIGFVGTSGNAGGTPAHLHFGVYEGTATDPCAWLAVDPLPLLVDR